MKNPVGAISRKNVGDFVDWLELTSSKFGSYTASVEEKEAIRDDLSQYEYQGESFWDEAGIIFYVQSFDR